jgi:hypothetical protein
MPVFNPFAGFSPSCCAVFVQMEHCAEDEIDLREKEISRNDMMTQVFMMQKYRT